MKLVEVVLASLVGLLLIAILSVFHLLKRHIRTLDLRNLTDSAKRIPTIPMMDPDSFEAADKPTDVDTR